jgi:carboxypeptidase C (cathepsin A)
MSEEPKKPEAADQPETGTIVIRDEPPVLSQGELRLGDAALRYNAQAGMLPIRNPEGEAQAEMFYVAYTLDGEDPARRPLTFVFNGGPGSSSVWLHLGALGPKRVVMQPEGWMPAPPYRLEDNAHTWLDLTDLVFIDPVGTGYSRAAKKDLNEKFWSLEGDFDSVGEFIRLYLTRAGRWSSPLFLAGESYGTTRASGLAGHLIRKGIAFNGLMLISTVMNFQTLDFEQGNDLPFALFLPAYTATAWYHKRLPAALQGKPLADVLAEVEAWVDETYTVALMKRDRLAEAERKRIVDRLARYTGLAPRFIDHSNLGIDIFRFCKELLREEKRSVGRLDSRYKGIDRLAVSEFPDVDPSMSAITPPYTAMMNDYTRRALGYETDRPYEVLNYETNKSWQWDRGQYPDTSERLRAALAQNPFMQVFVAMGVYDLATPYYATQYTLAHMNLAPEQRSNLHLATYDAGHMLYLDITQLARLKADVRAFVALATDRAAGRAGG